MPKPLPSAEYLHKLLSYDPETGQLFWKRRSVDLFTTTHGKKIRTAEHTCKQWNNRYAGKQAFTCQYGLGYFIGSIDNTRYLAHRVAYTLHHNEDPYPSELDHINGDHSDNRAVNLRKASRAEQAMNMPMSTVNRSGTVGVHFIRRISRWGACIQVAGKTHWLGSYEDKKDAQSARRAAEVRFGFHQNHGRSRSVEPRA